MIEPVTDHDEFALVRVSGGHGGDIIDCDGETIMAVAEKDMGAAEKAFPLIIQMYRQGFDHGQRNGRWQAQRKIQDALGLEHTNYRIRRLESSVFPGEDMT
jgi:hypothetical protein